MSETQLPSHWKVVKLGDCCHKPDYGYTASATDKPTALKFLRITDIQDNFVNWNSVPYCEYEAETINRYLLQPGDIVIARIGATTGKAYFIKNCPKAIFASYLIRIRAKADLVSEFISFYCQTKTYWKYIDQTKGGRLKGGVNIPILQNLIIPLPPLFEQKAIAQTLRTIQKAKEARQRELELERERKAALMQYLFTYGIRNEATKQTEIGEIPESWLVSRFDSFCILQRGFDITKKEQKPGSIPVISSSGVSSYHNLAKVKGSGVIIGRKGTLGSVHYVDCDYWPHDTTLWVKDFKENNPLFTAYLLERLNLKRFDSGASNPTLNRNTVHSLIIAYPQREEQQEISKTLNVCVRKIQALEKEISTQDELFRAMLSELMTGKLSTQPLTEQEN